MFVAILFIKFAFKRKPDPFWCMKKIIFILLFVCCTATYADAQAWLINQAGQAAKGLVKSKKREKEVKKEMEETVNANQSTYTVPPPATTLQQTAAQVAAESGDSMDAAEESTVRAWPRSKMSATLQKECLQILQARFPDADIRRVSIENENWYIHYKDATPEVRIVRVWADKDGGDGVRIAVDFTLCQLYRGGGQYDKTQFHSAGNSFFVISE